jgi:hypothetical protein
MIAFIKGSRRWPVPKVTDSKRLPRRDLVRYVSTHDSKNIAEDSFNIHPFSGALVPACTLTIPKSSLSGQTMV